MHPDANLQVWMDVHASNGQTVVAPYVSASRALELQYELRLVNTGQSGSSSVAQAGDLHVDANSPTQLSRVSVTAQPGGTCKLALTLLENGKEIGRYTLDCRSK